MLLRWSINRKNAIFFNSVPYAREILKSFDKFSRVCIFKLFESSQGIILRKEFFNFLVEESTTETGEDNVVHKDRGKDFSSEQ